ncbi:hypothetical protein JCM9279_005463 [Rhodotorula babjevae]
MLISEPKLDSHSASRGLQLHPLARVDLYARLGLSSPSSSISSADLRQAYRALILQHHPDRAGRAQEVRDGSAAAGLTAEQLNEAYEVLSDEATRSTYDAARAAALATGRATAHAFAVSLSLDLFDPHYDPPASAAASSPASRDEREVEDEPAYYTHPCRCSSQFRVTREQLEEGVEVVTCEGCSERCRVEYDVVEE